jgi:mannose-6-phosphate isomerase-like protein (cupin superfamily)
MLGAIQGKNWGWTACVYKSPLMEVHVIHADRGGYCSEHRHAVKWNRFWVLSGKLLVRIFRDQGGEDVTEVTAGQMTDVPPGVYHQFEALEDTVALEVYWVAIPGEDIERRTRGGMRTI